ncbi:uncharacterized protein SPSK_05630 [Sporothrix schenckii 1099-18]|uniref:DUF1531-domain-containing protein n=2 Tax=Sporothrix schenckii TaxID=29908 RepID=U7Q2K5_SPOS1|nr:uncharacterized protein SPSK_05630 [Sporothrix schenckii 1099-18]ERT02093.1 hypothetical protein HMPREF1624_00390 [Sporothrix schenckii ATCC 58251]KJR80699.1 hypothetical protein SPSK_05630 [Sporothrix schenckii 1099-18]
MAGLGDVVSLVGSRFANNLAGSFGSLTIHQWIRLVVIAGAYMLLRPYIVKLGGRVQMKQHEADEKASLAEAVAIANGEKPALSANDLRGGAPKNSKAAAAILGSDDEDDSDNEGAVTGAAASGTDWGKNARKRQRRMLRNMLEAHEQQLADAQADEDDKDIEEFLED